MDLNRATLLGRLTRDPEMRTTPNGKTVTSFSIATGRQWTDTNGQVQKQSEFHNIVVWGKLAETAGQYLRKASRVYVEGRLQTRDWTGQDGVKRYRTEIVADSFIMLDARNSGSVSSAPLADISPRQAATPTEEVVEEEIKVEDIPF